MSVGQIHLYVRDRDFSALGRGSHALKQVLERLSWFADEDGMSVFPKMQTIADALGITRRGVRVRMRALEAEGFVALVEEAKQHRPRLYEINVAKILSYPLTETGRLRLERENQAAPGGKTTSIPDSDAESREEKYVGQGGKERRPGGKTTSRHIDEESLQESDKESRRARATGPDGGPDAAALKPSPANTIWRQNLAALEALPTWPLLQRCIPDADDGETLTLAVERPLIGFAVTSFALQGAEPVLGRKVLTRVRKFVLPALIERGIARVGTGANAIPRRNNELVHWTDPAWTLWCRHKPELEALPYRDVLRACLPDDLTPRGLLLCCNSVAARDALRGEAGAAVAGALGVKIVVSYCWALDQVRAARDQLARSETPKPEEPQSQTGTG